MTTTDTTEVPTVAPADLAAIRLLAAGLGVAEAARLSRVSNSAMCMRLSRLRDRLGARTNLHAVVILARSGQLDLGRSR